MRDTVRHSGSKDKIQMTYCASPSLKNTLCSSALHFLPFPDTESDLSWILLELYSLVLLFHALSGVGPVLTQEFSRHRPSFVLIRSSQRFQDGLFLKINFKHFLLFQLCFIVHNCLMFVNSLYIVGILLLMHSRFDWQQVFLIAEVYRFL